MKKKILTILSVFSIVASLTACNSATETVDAAGNCDIWDNIEILDLYKDADYWKDIDENNEVFVWAKISTNGTKSINDDEAVVFPGNYSVFKDHAKIFILDGEIIVKEK